ncbi:alcohol dehydrogenase catalytic domain-containing protein, partial [bacterium]|nr:alcohol dehydrogenase catalytic domain-containing protein [bacterium]
RVPRPAVSGSEVLIRVTHASICGSDQHVLRGEMHPRTRLPLIPGHEFAGVVEECGPDAGRLNKGDRVTVDPVIRCGHCPACKRGQHPACASLQVIGIDRDGGFAEFVGVPGDRVHPLPADLTPQQCALIEVMSIGFHALNRSGLKAGDTAAIWGAGKIGQCILQACRTVTDKLVIVDVLDERLQTAARAVPGCMTVNAGKTDAVRAVREATGGLGVDVAFEAVGHETEIPGSVPPVRASIQAIRGGGTVCVLGLSGRPTELIMRELILKEAVIVASRVSHGEFPKAIEQIRMGTVHPERLVTDVIGPDRIQDAFAWLDRDPAGHLKIILEIG